MAPQRKKAGRKDKGIPPVDALSPSGQVSTPDPSPAQVALSGLVEFAQTLSNTDLFSNNPNQGSDGLSPRDRILVRGTSAFFQAIVNSPEFQSQTSMSENFVAHQRKNRFGARKKLEDIKLIDHADDDSWIDEAPLNSDQGLQVENPPERQILEEKSAGLFHSNPDF
jgi:hypothetical protein